MDKMLIIIPKRSMVWFLIIAKLSNKYNNKNNLFDTYYHSKRAMVWFATIAKLSNKYNNKNNLGLDLQSIQPFFFP